MYKLLLFVFLLVGCSQNNSGINIENPEETSETFQEILGNENEVEVSVQDWVFGMRDTYELDQENSFFLTSDGEKIEQINLNSVTKEEVQLILEELDFPTSEIFEEMLGYTEEELEDFPSNLTDEHFTNYNGTGVNLRINSAFNNKAIGFSLYDYNEPYGMNIVFDEDRFEDFK